LWNGYFQVADGQPAQADDLNITRPTVHIVAVPANIGQPPSPIFNPRQFGAKGDGTTSDTTALQKAMDACAGTGGSVVLSPGNYVSAELTLHGRMTLFLEKGAMLMGSTNLSDYPVMPPGYARDSVLCRSLLFACNADGLTIDGEGVIDGRCKEMNMPAKVRKIGTEGKRPSLIRIFRSRNVTVRNITLRNPCMWTQVYSDCDQLLIDHETVNAPPDCWNLDGMDICDSHDVVIRNCNITCEDDGICLKSYDSRGLQNVLIENNCIHCYRANAIKLGSATRGPVANVEIISNLVTCAKYGGLCIESVDGSEVNGMVVRNLDMYRVNNPIYIRLAHRSGNPGSITNVVIENVRAYETGYAADPLSGGEAPAPPSCTITGIPKAKIGGVRLKNCYIEMPGGVEKIPPAPAEREKDYPQSTMFGNVPAYGLYVRHAEDVVLDQVGFGRYQPDARPWLKADDAKVKPTACRDLEQIKPAATVKTK
jgi:polygalacturonase